MILDRALSLDELQKMCAEAGVEPLEPLPSNACGEKQADSLLHSMSGLLRQHHRMTGLKISDHTCGMIYLKC